MQVHQSLYDSSYVLDTAHRITQEVQTEVRDRPSFTSWVDILIQNPLKYLQFISLMDVALAKGSFPTYAELPPALQCGSNNQGEANCADHNLSPITCINAGGSQTSPSTTPSTSTNSAVEGSTLIPNTVVDKNYGRTDDFQQIFMQASGEYSILPNSDLLFQSMLESCLVESENLGS